MRWRTCECGFREHVRHPIQHGHHKQFTWIVFTVSTIAWAGDLLPHVHPFPVFGEGSFLMLVANIYDRVK